jgi:hypothetical protein
MHLALSFLSFLSFSFLPSFLSVSFPLFPFFSHLVLSLFLSSYIMFLHFSLFLPLFSFSPHLYHTKSFQFYSVFSIIHHSLSVNPFLAAFSSPSFLNPPPPHTILESKPLLRKRQGLGWWGGGGLRGLRPRGERGSSLPA